VVTRPKSRIHIDAPIAFNPTIGGYIRVDIGNTEHITWPRRRSTAQLVDPNATWTDGGLGLITRPSRSWDFELSVPDPAAVITACLQEEGWTWAASDKGRYAQALLTSVVGRERLGSLGDATALRVVRTLGSLTSRKAEQVLRSSLPAAVSAEQIEAALATTLPTLVPQWLTANEIASRLGGAGRGGRRDAIAALDRLMEDRLVRRAFRFDCGNCGMTSHVLFDQATEWLACEGCTLAGRLRGPEGEPVIAYGLNSLLDRAADQDCHIHLPVQDWIRASLGAVWSVPGADVVSATHGRREVDVLALSRSEVIVSEVKSSAAGMTPDAVREAALLASQLGADRLVLAVVGSWPETERPPVPTVASHGPVAVTMVDLDQLASA
jgi:hypothetical protein